MQWLLANLSCDVTQKEYKNEKTEKATMRRTITLCTVWTETFTELVLGFYRKSRKLDLDFFFLENTYFTIQDNK